MLITTLANPIDDEQAVIESVLKATDSFMTYRSRYLLELRPYAAIDLLINDHTNPRSLAFQLRTINQLLDELPTDESDVQPGADQLIAQTLLHRVSISKPHALTMFNSKTVRVELNTLLSEIVKKLPLLSDASPLDI